MTALPPELEALLVHHIRNRKKVWRWGSVTMVVMMVVLGAIAHFAFSPREAQGIVRLAGFGAIVGALFFLPSLGDPAKAKILRTLRDRRDDIVWLYVLQQRGQAAASWVMIGLSDGKIERVHATMGEESTVLNALRAYAPQATVGFSPQRQTQFASSPASLRASSGA